VIANHDIAGCILAGGQSRRMGEDKARFHLGGVMLLKRAIERLTPQVATVVINVHEETPDLARYRLPVVEDATGDHQGPLAGLLAALFWAQENHFAWIATVAVDTPFFPRDLVPRLAEAAHDRDMAVARSGGRLHPVFVASVCSGRVPSRRSPSANCQVGKCFIPASLHSGASSRDPGTPHST